MTDLDLTQQEARSVATDEISRPSPTGRPGSGTALQTQSAGSDLITDQGRTSIADSVVAKIAGVAAREIEGVHAMGNPAGRAIAALKEKVGASGAAQGVNVEVGERQAAIDLTLIIDYGVSIVDVADAVRNNVVERTESMTGLEVTEVNIDVNDVYFEHDDSQDELPPPPPPRVQ